jgi:arylsulfatase A-like enzyme
MSHATHKPPVALRRALAFALALACAISAALAVSAGPPSAGAAARPNIVLIQTDDQVLADLTATYIDPATGAQVPVMPYTLQLLAAQGVTFTRYYVSNPLCCPSRASLLTGRYSHNNGVRTNFFPSGGYYVFDKQNTLAPWLRNAGYQTSHVGKFLNEYGTNDPTEVPPGWSDWHSIVGADPLPFYGYRINDNGVVSEPHGEYDSVEQSYPDRDPSGCPDNPPPLEKCNYLTDVTTADALNAIRNLAPSGPFYLQVDYITPHGDKVPPAGPEPAPRHSGTLAGVLAPRNPGFNERDMSDKPAFVRANPRMGFGKIDYIDRRYEQRLEALRAVDEAVGKITDQLNAVGQLGNTYIAFISDNGFFQGEHRFDSAKFLPYEPSNHMPLVIRGPGLPPGTFSGELVANVDLAPTFLKIAGARSTASMDGRSLLAFAQDPAKRSRRAILLEGFTGVGEPGTPLRATASIKASPRDYEGIRVNRYKYIQYRSGAKELYDLKTDPYELHSRHIDPRYRVVKRWLAKRLRWLENCQAKICKKRLKAKVPKPLPKHKPKPKPEPPQSSQHRPR